MASFAPVTAAVPSSSTNLGTNPSDSWANFSAAVQPTLHQAADKAKEVILASAATALTSQGTTISSQAVAEIAGAAIEKSVYDATVALPDPSIRNMLVDRLRQEISLKAQGSVVADFKALKENPEPYLGHKDSPVLSDLFSSSWENNIGDKFRNQHLKSDRGVLPNSLSFF